MKNFLLITVFALLWVYTFAAVGLKINMMGPQDTKKLVDDVAKSLISLLPANVYLQLSVDGSITFVSPVQVEVQEWYDLDFSATYDATQDRFDAVWIENDQRAYSCSYSKKEQRPYSEFIRECSHYPLEKASLWLLKNDEFDKYLRVTYHPSVDEYSSFSPDARYLAFITDRLSGNRNIALLDLMEGKISLLPIAGSSEYFPRFSPDGKRIAFQGSLHGFWNIYSMPLENYSKNILLISAANNPAYCPNWYDANTILYVQDTETSNALYSATLARKRTKINLPVEFDMVFSPTAYRGTIYFVGLKDSDFGIYALTPEGTILTVENSFFNEHDPAISPDGRYLAYSCNSTGYYTIWVKDLLTQEKWCVTKDIPHDAFYPAFSVDGKLLAFSVYEGSYEPDIWFARFTPVSSSLQAESAPGQ
ncbi:MAG TPA: hypothetical protein PLP64_03265 [Pseudothermotoga sp.]|nr:hypothetical protein [Pseudothermotoga sp.]